MTEATGARLVLRADVLLGALHGREAEAVSLIEAAIGEARRSGQGIGVQFAQWAAAILFNGASRYAEALVAAQEASDDEFGLFLSSWALPELIEAAAKSRQPDLGWAPLERLAEARIHRRPSSITSSTLGLRRKGDTAGWRSTTST